MAGRHGGHARPRPAAGRRPGLQPLLHPRLAVLAVAGQPLHRQLPGRARGGRQRELPGPHRARPGHPHRGTADARGGLRVGLPGEISLNPRAHARHGVLRLQRLAGRRPPLHRRTVDRTALRPGDRRPSGGLAANPRRRPVCRPVVLDRGLGEPPRRDVVPARPAVLPEGEPRPDGRVQFPPRAHAGRQGRSRTPGGGLPPPLHPATRQLRGRSAHQARGPAGLAPRPQPGAHGGPHGRRRHRLLAAPT